MPMAEVAAVVPKKKDCHLRYCPPQKLPTQYDPPLVSPTQQYVKTNLSNTEVAHFHPSHTTTVNKHFVNNKHYFPHTESCVNECYEQHTMCGVPYNPCCPPRSFGFYIPGTPYGGFVYIINTYYYAI